jgi:uroporphyrinogen decarboxylase
VFTKGGGGWLDDLVACGASAVGLDWTVDLAAARARVGGARRAAGQPRPLVLLTDPATIEREAHAVVDAAGPRRATSSTSGTASCPATPPEHVAALVDAVHRRSRARTSGLTSAASAFRASTYAHRDTRKRPVAQPRAAHAAK